MNVEKDYEDVLHNLESAIVRYYREHPDLIDAEVDSALDWLAKNYSRPTPGRSSAASMPRGMTGEVTAAVFAICQWRLGLEALPAIDERGNPVELEIESLSPTEIVACLKRLKSSVKLWTKKGGRQGYLNFIKQFIPPEETLLKKQRNGPMEKLLGWLKRND
ncbi:MAG: hypothetical protein KME17_15365 [Cyanosarcina radialis HA8281-LM2]|jgi:hypothetical protein|nr:hypothetical protein [Cyanosarcina radialis HA8281-LM2]